MMSRILLIAKREFRQILRMRSFWLTLLLLPAVVALGPLLGEAFKDDESTRVMLIDQSNSSVGQVVQQRFELEESRLILNDLARYVRRYDLAAADPDAAWAQHDRLYTDADVIAFEKAGGVDAAKAAIAKVKQPETPEFDANPPIYTFEDVPDSLKTADAEQIAAETVTLFDPPEVKDGQAKPAEADLVIQIGPEYPAQPVVRLWSNQQPGPRFTETLRATLAADMRQRMLATQGVGPQAAVVIETASPAIVVSTPPPGGGAREAVVVRSIVPLALSYMLMMALMLSGSWMLQGSVEERSNKLLESVLAAARPEELMYGKLVGTVAVGLSMLLVWVACGAIAGYAMQGTFSDMIRPALEPLTSPGIIMAMIYFFILGYISISILFIAIGAMSDSMNEAQGYLMPVMFTILIPITLLIQSVLSGSESIAVKVLTWIPLWTPFAVLARLGMGIPWWEMVGAGLMLAAFTALELMLLGRLFRNSLLMQGQKPSLRGILDRLKPSRD